MGLVVIGLYGGIVPKTVNNFLSFATRGYGGYTYRGSRIFRVVKDTLIQGGDVVFNNGTGAVSSIGGGGTFYDESFQLHHNAPGMVGMVHTAGADSNGCQFMIDVIAQPWLDGQSVVFGKVITGLNIVKTMANSLAIDDKPVSKFVISLSVVV